MKIRDRGERLGKFLLRTACLLLIPVHLGAMLWYSVPVAGVNVGIVPESISPAQQQALDDANGSEAGQALQEDGLTGKQVIDDPDQTKMLDQFVKNAGESVVGPYVVFRADQALAENQKAASTVPPDRVFDSGNNVTLAFRQEFANERGILCAAGNIDGLQKAWKVINDHTNGMMLNSEPFTLDHKKLPKLPESVGTVTCLLYVAS